MRDYSQIFLHPPHTHQHQLNPAGLLVHLQRQYNPSDLPVRSQGCTYNPTGLPVRSQGCTLRQTPNQNSSLNLSSPSWVLCFMLYILQETARLSVCARQVRGSILRNFLVTSDAPSHITPIKMTYTTYPPYPRFCFILYILQETAQPSVRARQVRGSIPRNFGRFVAYLCRVVFLRQ